MWRILVVKQEVRNIDILIRIRFREVFFLFLDIGTLTSVLKDSLTLRSHKRVEIKVFFLFFCLSMEGSGSVYTDSDPGGLKHTDPAQVQEYGTGNWFNVGEIWSLVDISCFFPLDASMCENERGKHFTGESGSYSWAVEGPDFNQKAPRSLRFPSVQHRNRQSGSPLSLSLFAKRKWLFTMELIFLVLD